MTITVRTRTAYSLHRLEEVELSLPFWRYYACIAGRPYPFLLDSAKDPERLGRTSFMGCDPSLIYKAKRQQGAVSGAGARIEEARVRDVDGRLIRPPRVVNRFANVFEDLRRLLAEYGVESEKHFDQPVPFLCGAVGYFGYEAGYFIESLPDLGADDLGLPDIYLLFVDSLLAQSHVTGRSYISIVGRGPSQQTAQDDAQSQLDVWRRRIQAFERDPGPEWVGPSRGLTKLPELQVDGHFDAESYCNAVRTVKEHIFAGDAYEVCLTHRLESELTGDPWDLYQELRRINPAPFAAYFDLPEAKIVCSSPERFLSLSCDGLAESRPIKGTRPRGGTTTQDEVLRNELSTSLKDHAENIMIVDLVRNDFGRVSRFGSVHVPELMTVEQYATVFQLVSTIRGQLEQGLDGLDLLRACFPGGSMTGAPKIEAMKIIDRLEPVKRGIYSGSIGYIDFNGSLDLNIVIRTLIVKDGRCYFNVGGAIVADSDPMAEYIETLDKAKALRSALTNLKALA